MRVEKIAEHSAIQSCKATAAKSHLPIPPLEPPILTRHEENIRNLPLGYDVAEQ